MCDKRVSHIVASEEVFLFIQKYLFNYLSVVVVIDKVLHLCI